MTDTTNYKLLSDEPAYEFERKDELRFAPAAEVLAGAALQARNPITIGVFGNWGTGKTSFMRLMMEKVNEKGAIPDSPTEENLPIFIEQTQIEAAAIPVWFNAWQYEREEHLIIPLIATIAREIGIQREQWEKIRLSDKVEDTAKKALEKLKRGSKSLDDLLRAELYGISVKGQLPVPTPGKLEIGASAKDMIDRYEKITQDTLMARSLYFDAFDNLRKLARQAESMGKSPQIIVFIDDLDRCFPEKAVHLLESIKLILHLPGFAFVLGIYPEVIEEFIRNKYLAQYPLAAMQAMGDGKPGSESPLCKRMNEYLLYFDKYLEKIVQVTHYVSQREPNEMEHYIEQLLRDADIYTEFIPVGMNDTEKSELLQVIAEVGERNPRSIVRRINGFIVKWRIINSEKKEDEEPCSILALVVNEKAGDRKYSVFRDDLNVFVNKSGEKERTLGAFLADALDQPGKHRDRIENVRAAEKALACDEIRKKRVAIAINTLENDPELVNVLRTTAGLQWLWNMEFRAILHKKAGEALGPKIAQAEETESEKPNENQGKRGRNAIDELLANMILIPAGSFMMGSEEFRNTMPVHKVTLKAFELGATPVTQAQYEAVMGTNPSHFKGSDNPVECVCWTDAVAFCEKLSTITGKHFALPSEAQWEYACRAGSEKRFCFGDDETQLAEYAWYANNSEGKPHPVGQKKPNAWGLYDMHGNVWEWCQDAWHETYAGAPADGSAWEDLENSRLLLRGGSWEGNDKYCRAAYRSYSHPDDTGDDLGFRVARTL